MKLIATLIGSLFITAGFAQQNPAKKSSDSIGNLDNMPVARRHGNSLPMPTRNGKGNALAIPNRPTPTPLNPEQPAELNNPAQPGQPKHLNGDLPTQQKNNDTLRVKKD